MKKRLGKYIILFALGFAVLETAYFGHNITPKSPAELLFDIAALFIFLIGAFLYFEPKNK